MREGWSIEEQGGHLPHFQVQSERLMVDLPEMAKLPPLGRVARDSLFQGESQVSLKQESEDNLKRNSEEVGLQGLLFALINRWGSGLWCGPTWSLPPGSHALVWSPSLKWGESGTCDLLLARAEYGKADRMYVARHTWLYYRRLLPASYTETLPLAGFEEGSCHVVSFPTESATWQRTEGTSSWQWARGQGLQSYSQQVTEYCQQFGSAFSPSQASLCDLAKDPAKPCLNSWPIETVN